MRVTEPIPTEIRTLVRMAHMDDALEQSMPPSLVRDCINMDAEGLEIPTEIREECESWIAEQEQLQEKAADLIDAMLDEINNTHDGLPGWIQEDWPVIIRMPWSQHLGDAVKRAEECLTK